MTKKFKAKLFAKGPGGSWTFLPIPFDVEGVFGGKGRVPVSGTANGFAFRNSLMPEGDGTHVMMFSKALQTGANARPGETVEIVMQRDDQERTVTLPPELEAALKKNRQAAAAFAKMAYSHRKEYADWIGSAKQAETRERRAAKAARTLLEGNKR
jgi:hypothetical protein